MTDMTATYEVVHVLFIRPDVAAVKVRQRYLTLDGEQIGNEGTPMYVMAKEDGRWLLTANQNTEVLGCTDRLGRRHRGGVTFSSTRSLPCAVRWSSSPAVSYPAGCAGSDGGDKTTKTAAGRRDVRWLV